MAIEYVRTDNLRIWYSLTNLAHIKLKLNVARQICIQDFKKRELGKNFIERKIMVGAFILRGMLLSSILPAVYAQPYDPGTPPQVVQRVCSQCHALEIMGKCLAGDCAGHRVTRVDKPGPWDMVLDRMEGRGAHMGASERQDILAYLQKSYPPKHYPLAWKKVGDFAGRAGWNVNNLKGVEDFLYAGFEGDGKIFRAADGVNWQQVASTGHDIVYHVTPFKGALYAGIAEPDPQIWRSTDGSDWQEYTRLPAGDVGVYSVGVFKNRLYAGTGRGWIYRSDDGKKWQKVAALNGDITATMNEWTRFLIPFKGYLYAGIEQGRLYRSADGLTWTKVNLNIGDNNGMRSATVFNGELYVGASADGTIWKSKDGQAWQRVFKSPNDSVYSAAMAAAGKYLFASIGGYIYRTLDGLAWEEVGQLTPYVIEAMTAWRGNIYVGTLSPPSGFIYRADPEQQLSAP